MPEELFRTHQPRLTELTIERPIKHESRTFDPDIDISDADKRAIIDHVQEVRETQSIEDYLQWFSGAKVLFPQEFQRIELTSDEIKDLFKRMYGYLESNYASSGWVRVGDFAAMATELQRVGLYHYAEEVMRGPYEILDQLRVDLSKTTDTLRRVTILNNIAILYPDAEGIDEYHRTMEAIVSGLIADMSDREYQDERVRRAVVGQACSAAEQYRLACPERWNPNLLTSKAWQIIREVYQDTTREAIRRWDVMGYAEELAILAAKKLTFDRNKGLILEKESSVLDASESDLPRERKY